SKRAVAGDDLPRRAVRLAAPDRHGGRPGVPGVSTPGVLYVVATPIGNLEDVTLRALRVLGEVDLIAAEDTRRTSILLRHHGIGARQVSYYDAGERRRTPELVERMRAGARVALVTDAGTPGIADPGYHLVRGAIEAGIPVVPVPGASAVTALVSVAGLPVARFAFEGFLPARAGARGAGLRGLVGVPRAPVVLEAGRGLAAFLKDAEAALGEREAVIGRELTKVHEEFLRGRLSELCGRLGAREQVRGEVTIVVAGAEAPEPVASAVLDAAIRKALASGRSGRELSAALADELGVPRREVYRRALALRGADPTPKR